MKAGNTLTPDDLRPEIEVSWRRSRLYGLTRETPPALRVKKPGCRGSLQRAADPVFDRLDQEFSGAPLIATLADGEARITDLRTTHPTAQDAIASIGLRRGVEMAEDVVGTNAIGTVLETRIPLMLHGTDHFAHAFSQFTCFGYPVIHPVTHRLEGVLNVGGSSTQDDRFFEPIARTLVHDIEKQLALNSPAAQQELLAAFHLAAAASDDPVMVLGEGLTLASPAALDLLDPVAHAALRATAESSPDIGDHTLLLTSGELLRFRCRPVAGSNGVLVDFLDCLPTTARASTRSDELATGPLLICGETGTGRTTEATRIAGDDHLVLDAADVVRDGEREWAGRARHELTREHGVLVIENVDLLGDCVATVLSRQIGESRRRLVLTATGRDRVHPGLLSVCDSRRELVPLRRRRQDVPGLATRMLADEAGTAPVRLTPQTLRVLAGGTWPGNLSELRRVIRTVAQTRSAGDITPADLPEAYRRVGAPLSAFQLAERDVIVSAIEAAGGNKLRAARALGVSRSTLYNRMRALRITP
ncbi:sigma-54-dependent Fis family transcriptional regulator [Gordonia sp. FQ]|uniref:sigma-54-dependent Fis family transcriptional regulator n=1 Tax=Gordonia sp. FQ TaxID=3446634 RepID=UPI003F82D474